MFAIGYVPNWSEDVSVIKRIKNIVPWEYLIEEIIKEEVIGTFYENKLQKPNQEKIRAEKVIKRKRNKLYVKWKGSYNPFNSCIDKKMLLCKTWVIFQNHILIKTV